MYMPVVSVAFRRNGLHPYFVALFRVTNGSLIQAGGGVVRQRYLPLLRQLDAPTHFDGNFVEGGRVTRRRSVRGRRRSAVAGRRAVRRRKCRSHSTLNFLARPRRFCNVHNEPSSARENDENHIALINIGRRRSCGDKNAWPPRLKRTYRYPDEFPLAEPMRRALIRQALLATLLSTMQRLSESLEFCN